MQGVKDPQDRIRELEDHCEALENALALKLPLNGKGRLGERRPLLRKSDKTQSAGKRLSPRTLRGLCSSLTDTLHSFDQPVRSILHTPSKDLGG